MLIANNVSFAYGSSSVLSGIDVTVPRSGLLGILGPNGAGKTTLLRILAGILQPSHGRVTLDGRDLNQFRRKQLARRMAVVPQETHLAFDYSVLEITLMGRYPHLQTFELEGLDDFMIAREALMATGMDSFERRSYSTLSGGEKQRVIISSALAQFGQVISHNEEHPSAVLLLDEPTTALDLGYQLEIINILKKLNSKQQISIVVSTHDLNFASSLCSNLVLLRNGQALTSGPTNDVLTAKSVKQLYDVDAEVRRHDVTGHLVVIPLKRNRSYGKDVV